MISGTGRGFLGEDSSTGGGLGELGVSGCGSWGTVEAWGHLRGMSPGARSLRGESTRNGENRSVSCEEVVA